jgi:diguanylate cyclase (GGDEF)-like protein/PAS domain S-box-containing protein
MEHSLQILIGGSQRKGIRFIVMDSTAGGNSNPNISLQKSELRYRRLFEAAQDGILILDAKTGAITDVNPFLMKLLGYSEDEFIKRKLWEVGAFKDIKASKDAFKALQKNEYIRYKDLPLRTKDGRLVQVEFVSNVYIEGEDKVIQCNIRDITERKQAHEALLNSEAHYREQSVRDYLTGLFNRRYLEETLKRELHRASRKKLSIGIIMLDVDDFKSFNDKFGHSVGDIVLQRISQLFFDHIREEDIVARFGGDEFIIVMPDTSRDVTLERAQQLREDANNIGIQSERRSYPTVSLSLGVAMFPENGSTIATLLKTADEALYLAKNQGRNQVVLADPGNHPPRFRQKN